MKYQDRKYVIGILMAVVAFTYILRLLSLQIVNYEKYLTVSENNSLLRKTEFPTRGNISDRNGKLMVYNRAAYDMLVTMKNTVPFDTLDLCRTIHITPEQLRERLADIKNRKKNKGYSPYTPQVLVTQLSVEENGMMQEKLHKFPGFELRSHTLREYSSKAGAHILGSIGEVSQADIDNDPYYASGDFMGKSGIEKYYEETLRGQKGVTIYLRDFRGRIKERFHNGEYDVSAKAGQDMTLGIDLLLQEYGEKLMQGKRGGIVAIEPKTGEILAMVSAPSFDPALLVGRERSKNYVKLVQDKEKPLLNRATSAEYSPGSTFKTLQALVCLQLGGITENSYFPCNGKGSAPIKCTHSHGSPVSFLNAIEQSCNPYFWNTFRSTLEMNGYGEKNAKFKETYNIWREHVLSFGYGGKFEDSDVNEQRRGNIPTEKYFNKMFGETGWRAITIRSLAIGQGEILVTPLQLANLAATIANHGYYITPHLARTDVEREKHYVKVDPKHFDGVVQGMWQVTDIGSCRWYKIKDIPICGKTGTTQNSHGKDHSLFIGFAPKDDPQIAIAVVVENCGFGATWAWPIASLMTEMYLKREIDPNRAYIEERILNANFINDVQKSE
jgi:penicillin-binding protein 2